MCCQADYTTKLTILPIRLYCQAAYTAILTILPSWLYCQAAYTANLTILPSYSIMFCWAINQRWHTSYFSRQNSNFSNGPSGQFSVIQLDLSRLLFQLSVPLSLNIKSHTVKQKPEKITLLNLVNKFLFFYVWFNYVGSVETYSWGKNPSLLSDAWFLTRLQYNTL